MIALSGQVAPVANRKATASKVGRPSRAERTGAAEPPEDANYAASQLWSLESEADRKERCRRDRENERSQKKKKHPKQKKKKSSEAAGEKAAEAVASIYEIVCSPRTKTDQAASWPLRKKLKKRKRKKMLLELLLGLCAQLN